MRTSRKAWLREEALVCWTRVLRRSAGWRRKALKTPEPRPAAKWKAGRSQYLYTSMKGNGLYTYRQTTSFWEPLHGTLQELVQLIIVYDMPPASRSDAFVVICTKMTCSGEVASRMMMYHEIITPKFWSTAYSAVLRSCGLAYSNRLTVNHPSEKVRTA